MIVFLMYKVMINEVGKVALGKVLTVTQTLQTLS